MLGGRAAELPCISPSSKLDEYKRIKVLGSGSYGQAVLVERKSDRRRFVIKEVDMAKMGRAEKAAAKREAQLLMDLDHPNVVKATDAFLSADNRKLYIVMEHCNAGDLLDVLKARGSKPFPETEIVDMFVQICLGLKHVHDRKILHRDIKGQNVFCTRDGRLKLGDFGVARVLTGTLDLATTAVGTPYYLSPEICQNKPYSSKSDMWSMGCVLYEMATFKHAFDAQNLNMLCLKIMKAQFTPLGPRFSAELRDLVNRMLSKDPRRRPSVNEVLATPFIKKRIQTFLSQELHAHEFSHTVLHGQKGWGAGNVPEADRPGKLDVADPTENAAAPASEAPARNLPPSPGPPPRSPGRAPGDAVAPHVPVNASLAEQRQALLRGRIDHKMPPALPAWQVNKGGRAAPSKPPLPAAARGVSAQPRRAAPPPGPRLPAVPKTPVAEKLYERDVQRAEQARARVEELKARQRSAAEQRKALMDERAARVEAASAAERQRVAEANARAAAAAQAKEQEVKENLRKQAMEDFRKREFHERQSQAAANRAREIDIYNPSPDNPLLGGGGFGGAEAPRPVGGASPPDARRSPAQDEARRLYFEQREAAERNRRAAEEDLGRAPAAPPPAAGASPGHRRSRSREQDMLEYERQLEAIRRQNFFEKQIGNPDAGPASRAGRNISDGAAHAMGFGGGGGGGGGGAPGRESREEKRAREMAEYESELEAIRIQHHRHKQDLMARRKQSEGGLAGEDESAGGGGVGGVGGGGEQSPPRKRSPQRPVAVPESALQALREDELERSVRDLDKELETMRRELAEAEAEARESGGAAALSEADGDYAIGGGGDGDDDGDEDPVGNEELSAEEYEEMVREMQQIAGENGPVAPNDVDENELAEDEGVDDDADGHDGSAAGAGAGSGGGPKPVRHPQPDLKKTAEKLRVQLQGALGEPKFNQVHSLLSNIRGDEGEAEEARIVGEVCRILGPEQLGLLTMVHQLIVNEENL